VTPEAALARPAPAANGAAGDLARDVRRDLARTPKQLQPKYFYDALGSRLFDAICALPWYRITRAEMALLRRHGRAILTAWDEPPALVDLGCGTAVKTAALLEQAPAGRPGRRVHLVDVSEEALDAAERGLARFEGLTVVRHPASWEDGVRAAAAARPRRGAMLVQFFGSNIGNLHPPVAEAFLRSIRAALAPGDGLLLGADLVKPERELRLAYDDPLGLTAAFNKNVLLRLNTLLGADFDLDAFDHRAVWNRLDSRVEMHLVSRRPQRVHIPGADCTVTLEAGEPIWTESSYKYRPDDVLLMGEMAGFACREQWIEDDARFALTLFHAR
jgi:dimethylhistidine N-methyltransferase